jgi:tetratricopeptide (TPR) repeat protein
MEKEKTKKAEKILDIPIFTAENRTRIEHFIDTNKKILTYVLGGIVIIVLAFIVYKKFIIAPKEKEAKDLIFMAQNYFSKDSFELALNGKDESFYGFQDIIDEFGGTETGNLAKFYAGICYLRLDQYEEAIKYLKKFSTNSEIIKPLKFGGIGDAYSQLKEYDKAVKYYIKAAECKNNKFTTPMFYMKAGLTYEALEEYQKAKEVYEKVKNDYPKTQESSNADKYIGRVSAKLAAAE